MATYSYSFMTRLFKVIGNRLWRRQQLERSQYVELTNQNAVQQIKGRRKNYSQVKILHTVLGVVL